MAVDFVFWFPLGEHAVGDGVKSRHGVFVYEESPNGLVGLAEGVMVFADGEHVEGCHQYGDDQCREAFFLFYAEGVQELACRIFYCLYHISNS